MSQRDDRDRGFFLRGRIWWCRTDPVTGDQATTKATTRAQRDAWFAVRYRQSLDPAYEPPSKENDSLNVWAVKFVEHKALTKSAATAEFYRKKLGHFVRIFGANEPISSALRPGQMDAYARTRRDEGVRNTSIRKEIGAARTLARFAARAGAYHGRPDLLMPGDLSDDYEPGERYLTPDELVRLLAELTAERAAHVSLVVATAARFSEAFRITRQHVDTDAWLVHVPGTKTRRARSKSGATIPIAEPFRPLLLAALPYLPVTRWLNSNMVRDLGRACRRAGVTRVTANDLRRTHGSWLSQGGVGDEHIGKVLRHVDARMARRVYAKLPPAQLGELLASTLGATKTQQLVTVVGVPDLEYPIKDRATEGAE